MKPSKLDLFKTHKKEYVTPKKPQFVYVDPAQYLAIDGQGEPGGQEFQEAIGAMYSIAFTIKMTRKFAGRDYAVAKLECIYSNLLAQRTKWKWTMMIRTPAFIKDTDVQKAGKQLESKGKLTAEARQVKLVKLAEGQCIQMLHVGPYEKIAETVSAMEDFARENDIRGLGPCHEIYLNDPRRVAPAKLKTILRRSVKS